MDDEEGKEGRELTSVICNMNATRRRGDPEEEKVRSVAIVC